MNHRRHLHQGVSALVDGELGHDARDRALAHLAHCDACRSVLDDERSLKARISAAPAPGPSDRLLAGLRALSDQAAPDPASDRDRGGPVGPVGPMGQLAPIVPVTVIPVIGPASHPGRFSAARFAASRGPGARRDRGRGDGGRRDSGRPGGQPNRSARRPRPVRFAAAGALSVGVLVLGTTFAAGGAQPSTGTPVVPPAAELTIEHAATTGAMPLSDPAFEAVTASFGGLAFPSSAATAAPGR